MSAARNAILAGVSSIQVLGTPGTMIVHGNNTDVIMTDKNADVMLAAGVSGSGRVVVFSQDSYTHLFFSPPTSNHQLVKNIKNWVTYDSYVSDAEIENVDHYHNFDDIPSTCKILAWVGMQEKSKAFYEKMRVWINNGGGVVCGATPWGYLAIYPGKTLEDMPLNNVLNSIGIRYTDLYMNSSGSIYVSDNLAEHASVQDAVKASREDINNLAKYGKNIEGAITYLSDDELDALLPDITQMIEQYKDTIHCIPTKSRPIRTDSGKRLASLMNRIFVRTGYYQGEKVAEGIDEFPGDFSTPPQTTSGSASVSSRGYPSRSFPLGYYLPAGEELTVTWSSLPSKKWSILIGCHSDELYQVNGEFRRWPKIQISKKLETSPLKIRSPFGGAIFLKSPDNVAENVSVNLQNVVKTPIFVPGKGSEWNNIRNEAGLWASISGEKMTITLPSSSVRNLADPTDTMELWDEVVSAHYDLRGLDPYKGRGQWAVTDEQPSAGYMHAGYPVITMMDVADPNKGGEDGFLLNGQLLKTVGMWGMFHEIGHNLQDQMWTFSGTGEVTCNIFTLHAMEVLTGQKPWTHPWVKRNYNNKKSYLSRGANFSEWRADAGVALGIYAQLGRDFNWSAYKSVFREYNNLSSWEKPQTDDEKIDQWITRFSKNVFRNLCPMFDFWGFPIRSHVLDAVKHLSPFLHSDESTNQWAPARAAEIRRKYGMSLGSGVEAVECGCSYNPASQ